MICFKVKSFANIRRKEQDSFEKGEYIDVLFSRQCLFAWLCSMLCKRLLWEADNIFGLIID